MNTPAHSRDTAGSNLSTTSDELQAANQRAPKSASYIDHSDLAHSSNSRLAIMTLWKREMVTFFRAKSRLATALAFPVMLWLMLGFGLNSSFAPPASEEAAIGVAGGIGYLAYFFPGIIVMVLLFTAIFSTISVIDDRKSGFLQGVMVAPVSRTAIVLGKILGGATVAVVQAFILTALIWPFMDAPQASVWGLIPAAAAMIVVAISLTALGLAIAWPMDSTAAFHGIMNVLLMPMWFLCGALFPLAGAPIGLKILMLINPLTYGYTIVCAHLIGVESGTIPLWLAWVVTIVFTAVLIGLCAKVANKRA
ncbi:Inner membrane transport permease YbhR [Poriferisphaera corsica]|uniref:Transport permease protein n=1 Tax=Poriferisphaera corsica TaxID=2528020 RepID=A0A517YXS3_9BACT|nr:ABC transporter permease [Poriferisphaera corsica]QDU34999.1 Inner membrane transport permease YbhR [Poriferisphaera corsica]